jgi:hypothetical protein
MKRKINLKNILLIFISLVVLNQTGYAQDEKEEPQQIVRLHYYNVNNNLQYLVLESLLKTGRKIEPVKKKAYRIYLDSVARSNFIAGVLTNEEGKVKAVIPPELKSIWDEKSEHTFIVTSEVAGDEETPSEFNIIKSKIAIDTSNVDGVRNITATVMKQENNEWVPAGDVELKIGIRRMDNTILPAGEEPTYTTDSDGVATVEFNKINMPGDSHGNLIFTASVSDNDELGNLSVDKTLSWGVPLKDDNNTFGQRTLWSTRFKTPYWLLFLAYSISIGVWSTLIYLVFQLVKIKRLSIQRPG